jgi:hypothetical protein
VKIEAALGFKWAICISRLVNHYLHCFVTSLSFETHWHLMITQHIGLAWL